MQHFGIHSLTIEGDHNEGLKHLGRAQSVLDRLQRRLQLGGIDSGGDWEPLSDTAFLYVRVAMGVNAIRIVVDPPESDVTPEHHEYLGVPDFLSGVVMGGEIVSNAARRYWPTAVSQDKFKLKAGLQSSERLAVLSSVGIRPVEPQEGDPPRSQCGEIRPTLYSGRMRLAVQLLLGYGKREAGIYKDVIRVKTDGKPIDRPATEYELDVVASGYQVRFDYRAYRTHGITVGTDGVPWLVEISAIRGIHAMQLPMAANSNTAAFREYLEELEDTEALAALAVLGGFPSGEGMPTDYSVIEAMKRAGLLVELLPTSAMSDFYNLIMYSSAMGWAFNASGNEAHNTGYEWDENGWQFGEHYNIRLVIGALRVVEPAVGADALRSKITALEGLSARVLEINTRKIDRLNVEQIKTLQRMPAAKAYEELDKLQLEPVAPCSASIGRAGRGSLYNPGAKTPYQIKFWEPAFEGGQIISHDFTPEGIPLSLPPPLSDTAMLVFFRGDQLSVTRYFHDILVVPSVSSDDFEECMYAGEWTSTTTRGGSSVNLGFYTSEHDPREYLPGSQDVTKIKGADLGWSSVQFGDVPSDIRVAVLTRSRRFHSRVERIYGAARGIVNAIVWPGFAREAYYLAKKTIDSTEQTTIQEGYQHLGDPNWATTWRAIVSTIGGPIDFMPECGNKDKRRVQFIYHSPYACSDLIDQGPWMSKCDIAETLAYNIPPPPLPENIGVGPTVTITHEVKFVSAYYDDVTIDAASDDWYIKTPDEGVKQFMWATGNSLGDSQCTVYSAVPNGGFLLSGYPNFKEITTSLPCFIGVV
ncbi:MAG: hypothetical protein K2Y25_09350 [Pseudomonadaceae bacterium]|nr:hypothetical protein [Pseudomonadaceae bacterium]